MIRCLMITGNMRALVQEYGRMFSEAAHHAEIEDAREQMYLSPISCIWQSQSGNLYAACVACEKLFRDFFGDCVAENNTQAILMLGFIAEACNGE